MNIKKVIKSERGDVSYISTFVYILVAMIMVAFILNVFHIISVKQEMDHISDQLVKQIQLNGGTNADTGALFSYLAAPLSEVEGHTYQVTSSGSTNRIQIGSSMAFLIKSGRYIRWICRIASASPSLALLSRSSKFITLSLHCFSQFCDNVEIDGFRLLFRHSKFLSDLPEGKFPKKPRKQDLLMPLLESI